MDGIQEVNPCCQGNWAPDEMRITAFAPHIGTLLDESPISLLSKVVEQLSAETAQPRERIWAVMQGMRPANSPEHCARIQDGLGSEASCWLLTVP